MTARVQDVSRGGINLIVDRELEAGRQLLIELPDTDLLPAAIIMANLMRVSEHQGGKWILGCTFATELADEDLAPFGAQLVRPDTADKRAWVRYPCNAPANCQIMRTGETEHFAGRAIDLSAGGIALEVDHYLEIGTTISVELRAANGKLTLSLLACVVRASVGPDNRWFLGCNFVRELADKELQAWLAASACRTPAHAVS